MNDLALLILRLFFGGLMLTHGYPKLLKLFNSPFSDLSFPDPLGVGPGISLLMTLFAEIICVLFIIVGYRVRLFALPLIFVMLVAALIVHAGDPLRDREMALLYLAGYTAIALLGSGKYTIFALRR
jgi:putative oxidoreductase